MWTVMLPRSTDDHSKIDYVREVVIVTTIRLADLLAKAGSPALCAEELSPRPEPIVTLGHTEYRERGARRREGTGIPIIWDRLLSK